MTPAKTTAIRPSRSRPPVRRRRRLPAILRGIAALLTLIALVAGLPVLLYRLGGSPIPGQLPNWQQIWHTLTRQDNGSLFLAVVRDISWVAWAAFTIAVIAEVQAAIRGSAAPRLRLGGVQAVAARLVVLAMLGLSGPGALLTMTQVASSAQAATTHGAVTTAHSLPTTREQTPSTAQASTAQAGTAESSAAQASTAQASTAQPSASSALGTPLTEAAAPLAATPVPASHQPADDARSSAQVMTMSQFQLVTVHAGDCLWTIAQHYLGDGDRYQEIARVNLGRDMGGVIFSNPSVILTGWVLRVPASDPPSTGPGTSHHPAAGHGPGTSHHPAAGHGSGAAQPGRGSTPPGSSGPSRHDPHPSKRPRFRQSHPAASATPGAPTSNGGPAAGRHITAVDAANMAEIPLVAVFAAGMLAGGAAVSLTRMRNRQRQYRRPGRRIALPAAAPVISAEQRLRADAGLIPANWLRAALSDLGTGLAETGQQVPEIAAVRILPEAMEILLASPASEPPPAPFTVPASRQGLTWRLVIPPDAPEQPPPTAATGDLAPGLVTIGVVDDGYLLVDLEYLGVTVADGPEVLVDQVLTTAAAELAASELAGWYDLILIGFPELSHVGSRTTCCDDLAEALDLATAKAVTLRRRLGDAGPTAVRRLRVFDPGDEDWALTLLISRIPPTPAELALLTDLVSGPGGTAALLPAGRTPAQAPGTADLEVDYAPDRPDGIVATIMPSNLQAYPRPLTPADYRALTSLFAIAAQDGDVAPDDPPYDGSLWPPDLPELAALPDLLDEELDGDDRASDPGPAAPTGHGPAAPIWPGPADAGRKAWRAEPGSAPAASRRLADQLAPAPDASWSQVLEPESEPALDASWRQVLEPEPGPALDASWRQVLEPETEPEPEPALDASWRPASEPEEPEPAAGSDLAASLRIGLLGTLTINGQPGALLPAQSQLIVALALNGRDGLSNRQLCYLLGADPDHPRPPDSLRQLIVRTRRQLGPVADGREWIEHLGSGQYALHPGTRVDWHEFEAMTSQGIEARDPALLNDALRMIRGQPFTGCYYWWLDIALVETVRAQIVDAAELLAELDLADRNPAAAARAARIGLAADSAAEQLWRALMRAEHAAGNLAGVREAWSHCLAVIGEIAADGQPHPDTAALYRDLLGGSSARFTGSWPPDR